MHALTPRSALVSLVALTSLTLIAGAACRTASAPPLVQPGAPGQASRPITADKAADLSQAGTTAADVRFMQGMIHHHAQALDMTALLETRTESADMRKLASRIAISQTDEIKMMREWLAVRHQEVPGEHAHQRTAADAIGPACRHECAHVERL